MSQKPTEGVWAEVRRLLAERTALEEQHQKAVAPINEALAELTGMSTGTRPNRKTLSPTNFANLCRSNHEHLPAKQ